MDFQKIKLIKMGLLLETKHSWLSKNTQVEGTNFDEALRLWVG